MSTAIDQQVVEMRFDNKQFESGVSTTLSTLDKLKQRLRLDGATKGMEDVNAAARNINMAGLGTAVETVQAKFSALGVIGVTALANITNQAINTGKRMLSALTIDPIKTGLQEYETQINAVQTILANTESKGTTLDQVNGALDTLNTYADKTIYNFTEMTRNIGTFTAAGVDLDTSVNAIQGIANLAAVSGSSSQQASTAMYQLSQALASGTVKLMDWNSVVNAGMGGQVFQDALKETARVHGVAIDDMIKNEGSFRETLSKGWLTSDILTETLSHFTMAAEEGSKEWNAFKKELMDDGYTEEQANAILKLSNTATDAATKVKTATQLWDTLKETAQSGWTQTWEIILGDFGEAKELFSGIYETLAPIIEKSSEARNALLEGAMTSNWDKMVTKINEAGIETTKFEEKVKATAKAHNIDIDKMIEDHGSLEKAFQSGAISSDILKEAIGELEGNLLDLQSIERDLAKGKTGEDVEKVQAALKGLGYDLGKAGVDGAFGSATEKAVKAFQEAQGLKVTGIVDEETIKALENASGKVEGLSDSIEGLISGVDKLGGRDLLIKSLQNVFDGLMSVVKPIKEAFDEIFPPTTVEQLYSLIEGIHNFTSKLTLSETASDNLKRTFKGLFAVVDIVKQVIGAVFKLLGPLFGQVDNLGGGILGITAKFGDWLVTLDESIKSSGALEKAVEWIHSAFTKLGDILIPIIDGIKEFGKSFSESFSDAFGTFTDSFSDAFGGFSAKAVKRLEPLAVIGTIIKSIFVGCANAIKAISPFIFAAAKGIGTVLGDLMKTITNAFQNANYDSFFDLTSGGLMTAIGVFIAKFIKSGGDLLDNTGGFIDGLKDILGGVSDALGTFQDSLKADTLKKIATAIAILAAALLVLALIPSERLTLALVSITTLFGELMGAMAIFNKIGDVKGIAKTAAAIVTLSAAILILSVALKIMSTMSWSEMGVGLISLTVGLGALVGAVNLLPETKVRGAAKAIKSMSTAILILAVGIKIMSTMSWEEMGVGLISMVVGLGALVGAVNLLPKDTALRAAGMIGLATAMVILGAALKIMATMSWGDIARSLVALGGSLLILAAAMNVMMAALPGAAAMLVVAPALIALALALKVMATMSWGDIARGLVALGGSMLILAVGMNLMMTALPGAAALLVVAGALAILTPILMMLGSMSLVEIGKSLLMIAGVFAVLGVAALVLQPLIPTILSLAGALTLLGVSCVAIGAGVLMLGLGLTAIAAAGSSVAVALVTIVASIIGLIPYLIEQIGHGIILLCEVIAGGADAICKAATVIILALVDALVASVPAIVEGVFVLLDEILKSLVNHTPTIVAALFDFLIAILDTISQKLPELIQAGVNLVMAFFTGVIDALKSIDPTVLVNGIMAIGMITALMVSLAAMAVLAPAAMVGVLALGTVITELAIVLAAIGALAQIPGLDWLIGEGGNLLQAIGTAIGQFVGGIAGGFAQGMSASLPQIGSDLSAFMTNAKVFIDGAKSIDSRAMDGVKSIVGIIAALTAVDILQSLTSWITGGSSLTKFGEELAAFGPNIKAYADSIAGIDSSAVEASANAAMALAKMTSEIPNEGGIAAWFAGENSISKFGQELLDLGTGLKNYSDAIVGFDAEAVIASTNAALALANMTSQIPNEGGVAAWFAGDNSISKFGEDLVSLGEGLKGYSDTIVGFDAEAVIASTNAAKALVDMTSNIPNEGGVAAWFAGENSVAKFGGQLLLLGQGLKDFSDAVVGIAPASMTSAANAANTLAQMTKTVPSNTAHLKTFGENLIVLGGKLKTYFENVGGITSDAIMRSAEAIKAVKVATTGLNASTLTNAGNALNALVAAVKKMASVKANSADGFASAIEKLGKTNVSALVKTFEDAGPKLKKAGSDLASKFISGVESKNTDVTKSGEALIAKFIEGVTNKNDPAVSACKKLVEKCATAISESATKFKSAAANLVKGFASGISQNTYLAKAKARAMARAAANAAEEELDINSPSRVGESIGNFFGLGFVNAIDSYATKAYSAGSNMAEYAKNGLNSAINKIGDYMDANIDTQPTIRPVIDLTNVRAGANAISSLFNANNSVGVMANVNSISTSMGTRNQNGANEDVVTALNKLRKDLNNVGNVTYQINGITYDDGSNISSTIKDLVRHARLERRV